MATLDLYSPFDDGPGANATEDTWRQIMRRLGQPGVLRSVLGEAKVYGDSTGMQVKVPAFECWIEGHWGRQDAEKTLPIATAHGSLARLDLVVVRADYVANEIRTEVITGVAASSPVLPDPVQNTSTFDVPIAAVSVAAGAVTIASTDVIQLSRMAGGNPGSPNTDDFSIYGDKISMLRRVDVNTTGTSAHEIRNNQTRLWRMSPLREQTVSSLRVYFCRRQNGGSNGTGAIFTGWDQTLLYFRQSFTFNLFHTEEVSSPFVRQVNLPVPITVRPGESIALALYTGGSPTQTALFGCYNTSSDTANLINPDTSSAYTSLYRTGDFTGQSHINGTPAGGWTKATQIPWVAFY